MRRTRRSRGSAPRVCRSAAASRRGDGPVTDPRGRQAGAGPARRRGSRARPSRRCAVRHAGPAARRWASSPAGSPPRSTGSRIPAPTVRSSGTCSRAVETFEPGLRGARRCPLGERSWTRRSRGSGRPDRARRPPAERHPQRRQRSQRAARRRRPDLGAARPRRHGLERHRRRARGRGRLPARRGGGPVGGRSPRSSTAASSGSFPLRDDERAAIPDLVLARVAISVAISAIRRG